MARKRLARFKEMRRAYISFWLLVILYLISLCSEIICNSVPLYVKYQGRSYFPVFKFYPEDVFTGNGKHTRPDYHAIYRSKHFQSDPDNTMLFPLFRYGPYQSIDPEFIEVSDHISLFFTPLPKIGTVNIRRDYSIARSFRFGDFIGLRDDEIRDRFLKDLFILPSDLGAAVSTRFAGKEATAYAAMVTGLQGEQIRVSLSTKSQRKHPPSTVRISFREILPEDEVNQGRSIEILFNRQLERLMQEPDQRAQDLWQAITEKDKHEILSNVKNRYYGPVDYMMIRVATRYYRLEFVKEDVRFPFPPVKGHLMGIDGAGRDVLARILYGMRTSMTFGLMLVVGSMVLGVAAGSLQGYYGGLADITGQRLIEIWSALPFLYIMILMGSIYGRSFALLLFCYGLFNWIGISYYIRAEFLRLRKQPFVESAKCMGVSSFKIIFRHILPNGMVPVITFFPFSLVGAIGALAALDYLGFGLPPPTPSWGELLFQAQQYRWAWWLILYPSLSLFIIMLLGVFVGEGIRNAYDPKRYTRLE